MARYRRLLRIMVSHEYLADNPVPLRFVPTEGCAALMAREDMVLRAVPGGAELWREEQSGPADGVAGSAPAAPLALAFHVFTSDPQLQYCTAWPVAAPLRFVNVGDTALLQAETLAGSGAARAPLFSVEIAHRAECQDGDACTSYQIALASKKIHWKYFFFGSLATKKLSIVDLDRHGQADGIRFSPSDWPATEDGSAYTSEAPLALQRLPQQRLQLREEGEAGKVLIRRLPNATFDKLGKERWRDGQSMIVAEIYIHQ